MNQYFTNTKARTLEETYDATVSASTEITLNTGATSIEVSAIDKGIFLKWGATASSSDFDEFISANTTREYIIPTGTTTVQFIEESATAKLVVIEK
jgi:archaellum component FlaF (FlaF/FlaG flagellin family)